MDMSDCIGRRPWVQWCGPLPVSFCPHLRGFSRGILRGILRGLRGSVPFKRDEVRRQGRCQGISYDTQASDDSVRRLVERCRRRRYSDYHSTRISRVGGVVVSARRAWRGSRRGGLNGLTRVGGGDRTLLSTPSQFPCCRDLSAASLGGMRLGEELLPRPRPLWPSRE